MSISVKISQLDDGGSVASTDQIPVARGSINTFKIPANQFVINGSNVGIGTGQLFFDRSTGAGTTLQFRSLSGADGINVVNAGDTIVVSASGQNPVKTSITGNGTTTTFAVNGAGSINPNNYRVDIDGVLQEPINDYTIVGSNIVFNPAPPNGSKVTVVSNNLVRAYDIIPSDGSVTTNKIALSAVTTDTLGPDIRFSIVPTGAIMPFYRSTAPTGWLICDGSAIPAQFTSLIALVGANTPNLRGMFIRGWSPGTSTTSQDPLSASRTLGSVQGDAIRNITGEIYSAGNTNGDKYTTNEGGLFSEEAVFGEGALTITARRTFPQGAAGSGSDPLSVAGFGIDASLIVPTAPENRPVNIALLYCIKT